MFFLSHSVTPKPERPVKESKIRHVVTARIQLLVSSADHFPGTEHLSLHSYTFQSALGLPHMYARTHVQCYALLISMNCHKTSKEGSRFVSLQHLSDI